MWAPEEEEAGLGGGFLKGDPGPGSSLLTQSTMRTLPTFNFCCKSLVVMATELKKQNPLREGGGKGGEVSGLLHERDTCITLLRGKKVRTAGLVQGWVALTWLWIPQHGVLGAG